MIKLPFNKIMVISPHTDDMEFGCAGTIHRLIQQGCEIYSVIFSICEDSVPEGLPKETLMTEMYNASKIIGLQKENITVFRFPVRKFPQFRQEILENLVKLNRKYEPDLVLTLSSSDIHQDHHTIYQESLRAFKYSTILGYELPWNDLQSTHQCSIKLNEQNIKTKINAIECYKSQNFRHYKNKNFFFSQAQLRGMQNRTLFAEAFEVIRLSL